MGGEKNKITYGNWDMECVHISIEGCSYTVHFEHWTDPFGIKVSLKYDKLCVILHILYAFTLIHNTFWGKYYIQCHCAISVYTMAYVFVVTKMQQ